MPAPVSIIIPTLNAAPVLPATLSALFEGMAEGVVHEVIIVDGGSDDATAAMAEDAGAVVLDHAPGRGGQLAAGAAAARAPWLLFLHADSQPDPGWSAAVLAHVMAGQGTEQPAAAFRLAFDDTALMARVTAGWANLRSRIFALPYGDQGLLLSRARYQAVGGFDPMPLMEDVAMARKLRRIVLLPVRVTTSGARYRKRGWIRQGAGNLWRLVRYLLGAAPDTLARGYRR